MAKQPTIVSVTSGYMSATQITANDEALRDAFDNTVSLDGSTPNAMNADFDLNGNDLLNGGVISGTSLLVGGVDLTTQVAAAAASAAAAAADVLLTAADVVTTNADVVLTAADVLLTAADVVTTNADASTTTQDAIDTAADLVATNQDTIDTAADVLLTAADVVTTNANAATTTQDAIDTAADAASTAADVITVAATLDAFDDRYLGAKASDPTLDNDGNALLTGALYFNTSANEMRVYSGSAWLAAYVSAAGTLLAAQNLSDLNNANTALANLGGTTAGIAVFKGVDAAAQRTSLGLGTAAVAATGDFATAAQGTLAGTALQPDGDGSGLTGIAGTPTGAVLWFAANAAPTGFLKANGAAISRTTYSDLFAAIGTVFGVGDGSTTFNVPELRGEFIRGWDDARGVDGSRVFGSAQTDEFEAHTHDYTKSNITRTDSSSSGTNEWEPISQSTEATSSVGGASETRPRNIALLACISF
jgi:microcystin-dependent protein